MKCPIAFVVGYLFSFSLLIQTQAFLLPSSQSASSSLSQPVSSSSSIINKNKMVNRRVDIMPPLQSASTTYQEDFDVGQRIREGLLMRWPASEIERVLESWDRMVDDKPFKDDATLRYAASYMEGLESKPWHDVKAQEYEWLQKLEENVEVIQKELQAALENKKDVEKRGTNVWVGAARDEGEAYGPNWKTLVLQDREWDEKNAQFFPNTTQLIQSLNAPTVEVFFAKQDKKTGIQSHSDGCNFILTAHLGLDVPDKDCWIKVGTEKKNWKNGETLIFDTHYLHETCNESKTKDRYVLLMRFWHPQVTKQEQEALSFVFKALEGPEAMTDMDFDFLETLANDQLRESPADGSITGTEKRQKQQKKQKVRKNETTSTSNKDTSITDPFFGMDGNSAATSSDIPNRNMRRKQEKKEGTKSQRNQEQKFAGFGQSPHSK